MRHFIENLTRSFYLKREGMVKLGIGKGRGNLSEFLTFLSKSINTEVNFDNFSLFFLNAQIRTKESSNND